jgi:hypothetical protein
MVLTVLSHELATVILFFILVLEVVRFLVKRKGKDVAYLISTGGFAFGLFVFTHYSPAAAIGISIPLASTASEPSVGLALFIGGMLVYCYFLLAPLVVLGFILLESLGLFACVSFTFFCS